MLLAFSPSRKLQHNGPQKDIGLTEAEKKTLLDEHNRLRAMQALGKVAGQPTASDMTYLEWSDEAAKHAQVWANNCGGPMHGNHKEYGEGQDYADYSDRSVLFLRAFELWFDKEFPRYSYGEAPGKNGHYTQMVTSYTTKVGCGANKCTTAKRARLVCNFFIGGNFENKPPFSRGRACTKCPEKFGYCLDDALCASAAVCKAQSDRKCRCTVDQGKCSRNGKYDSGSCHCKCNTGWQGLNCEIPCEDPPKKACRIRAQKGECKKGEYIVDMMLHCPAACGKCSPVCKNKRDDCKELKKSGNCEDARDWMLEFCQKECDFCKVGVKSKATTISMQLFILLLSVAFSFSLRLY